MAVGMDATRGARTHVVRAALRRSITRHGSRRPLPEGVPRPGPTAARARGPGADAGCGRDRGLRRRHGSRGRVALPGSGVRDVPPATLPALRWREHPTSAHGRRCRGRRRRDLQGTGDRCGVRARGSLPRGSRPPHAAPRTGGVGRRLPRVRVRERDHTDLRGPRVAGLVVRRPRGCAPPRRRRRHRCARLRVDDPDREVDRHTRRRPRTGSSVPVSRWPPCSRSRGR